MKRASLGKLEALLDARQSSVAWYISLAAKLTHEAEKV